MNFTKKDDVEAVWCCVRDCTTNNEENQCSLFSLPTDNERSYLWLKNANCLDLLEKCYDFNFKNSVRICGAHFQENMFSNLSKNSLFLNAVPTIFEFAQQYTEPSQETFAYSKIETICVENNEEVAIIGEVVKMDTYFEDNTSNMEIISTKADIDAEVISLGNPNRTSTVISIVKHDTVVPVSGMESVFFKNNIENIEKCEGSQQGSTKQENNIFVETDEDVQDGKDSQLMEALIKTKKTIKKGKKISTRETSKLLKRRKIRKRAMKRLEKHTLASRKNMKRIKEETNEKNVLGKNFIELRRKDFYKICKICFNDDINELVDISNSNCQGNTFVSILENYKNYDQNNAKHISRFICQKCTTNLLDSHNFFNNLQKSTGILMDTYKTLVESSNRKAIRISNWESSMLKIEDCQCEKYAESIKKTPLNVIETIKVERSGYDSDRFKNDPNDDSYWSDEDYDSLIKIKRINALKHGTNNESTNDDNSREFAGKIEVITEDNDSSSDSDTPPRKRRRKYNRHMSPRRANSKKLRKRTNRPRLPKDYVPSEDDLTCPDCKKVFPNRASLGSHQRNVHVTVECDVCGMRLKGASIRWHMRVMHSMVNGVEDREKAAPAKVLCVKCGKWVRAHKYKIHLKTHMVTKPFACDICDYRTSDKHRLIPHKLLHTGEKPHLCATCGEGFHRKDYLKVHVTLHTPLDVPITCNTCPQSFGTKFEYHTHRRLIHGYQKVGALPRVRLINGETVQTVQKSNTRNCHICQKVFPRNNKSFYVHMREHIPRPVRCTLCNKQCNSPEALKSHMRTHTGEKPFKCKLCDKAYSQYGHLQSHRATFHENKRAFKCEYCDKAFNLSIGLKEHIRIHTGETLDCDHCGKAFRQRSNFYKHLREVHSIRKRELNREQSAAQTAPERSGDGLNLITNALTE